MPASLRDKLDPDVTPERSLAYTAGRIAAALVLPALLLACLMLGLVLPCIFEFSIE